MTRKGIKNHIKHLKEHKGILESLIKERQDLATDFEIEVLKKRKLKAKDEIELMKLKLKKLEEAK